MATRDTYRRTRTQPTKSTCSSSSTSDDCTCALTYTAPKKPKYTNLSYKPAVCVQGQNPVLVKTICGDSIDPSTTQAQELLALWEQICPNFDPNYEPPPPENPFDPICVGCLPANPELLVIFEQIADILEQ